MLITVETNQIRNNELGFELPQLYLDPNKNYVISIEGFHLELDKKVNGSHFVSLSTTLVDRNPCNPYQEVLFFVIDNRERVVHITPSRVHEYKIQLYELNSAVFALHFKSEDIQIERIKFALIQLKIEETYGRI